MFSGKKGNIGEIFFVYYLGEKESAGEKKLTKRNKISICFIGISRVDPNYINLYLQKQTNKQKYMSDYVRTLFTVSPSLLNLLTKK